MHQFRIVCPPLIGLAGEVLGRCSSQHVGFLRHEVRHWLVRAHGAACRQAYVNLTVVGCRRTSRSTALCISCIFFNRRSSNGIIDDAVIHLLLSGWLWLMRLQARVHQTLRKRLVRSKFVYLILVYALCRWLVGVVILVLKRVTLIDQRKVGAALPHVRSQILI